MKVEKLYRLYMKKIEQGEPIQIRTHHLRGFYECVKHDKWFGGDYFPDYNEKLVKALLKKIAEKSTSKVKVVADFGVCCHFCPKHFYATCDNLEQIEGDMKEFEMFFQKRLVLDNDYSPSELLDIIFEAYKPNIDV